MPACPVCRGRWGASFVVFPLYTGKSDESCSSTSRGRAARHHHPCPAPQCRGWLEAHRPLAANRAADSHPPGCLRPRPPPTLATRQNHGRGPRVRARRRPQPSLRRAHVRPDPLQRPDRDHGADETPPAGRDRAPVQTRGRRGHSPLGHPHNQPGPHAHRPRPHPLPRLPYPRSKRRAPQEFSVSTTSRRDCGEVRRQDRRDPSSRTRSAASAPATASPNRRSTRSSPATKSTPTGRRTVSWPNSTARSSTTTSRPTAPRTPTSSKQG
jgi:hypothetical protein